MLSPSQLMTWRSCRLKWYYRYKLGLSLPEASPLLASGTAIHKAVAETLRGNTDLASAIAVAEESLRASFSGRGDLEAMVARYLPGCKRALARLPAWLTSSRGWRVEELVAWGGFRGIVDAYRLDDDGVCIVEVKSTSKPAAAALDYLLWNPQHRYYGVMLAKLYKLPVYIRYVVLSTAKRANSFQDNEWLLNSRSLASAEADMTAALDEVGQLPIVPTYSRACGFCDYKQLCTATITGADEEAVIAESYIRLDNANEEAYNGDSGGA